MRPFEPLSSQSPRKMARQHSHQRSVVHFLFVSVTQEQPQAATFDGADHRESPISSLMAQRRSLQRAVIDFSSDSSTSRTAATFDASDHGNQLPFEHDFLFNLDYIIIMSWDVKNDKVQFQYDSSIAHTLSFHYVHPPT
jgi:hypothetical protein